MRYFIYARRSSEDKTKQIQSIPNQLEWAERMRVRRQLDIIDTFTDTKTGTKPGREGFNAMMEAVEASPEPVGILCWKINRLARNPIDEGAIKYAFMRGKVRHILASGREFRESENQIIMGVEFGNATQFSIDLSHDVKRGMSRKVEQGWFPGVAPLGYLNDPSGLKGEKKIIPDSATWDKVRRLWDLLLTGRYTVAGLTSIANDELGLRNKRGGKLGQTSLHYVFHNLFYTGYFMWNGQNVHGMHEPMITLAEFDRADRIISGDKPKRRKNDPTWNGLIRCGECGCMITTEAPKSKFLKKSRCTKIYRYLRCTKKSKVVKCRQSYLRLSEFDDQVGELLAGIRVPRDFISWTLQELNKAQINTGRNKAREKAQLQQQLELLEAKIATLTDKLVAGVLNDQMYQISLEGYEKDRCRLQKALERIDGPMEDVRTKAMQIFDFANQASAIFRNGDAWTRRTVLSALGSNHRLLNGRLLVELHSCFQAFQKVDFSSEAETPPLEPQHNRSQTGCRGHLNPENPMWLPALKLIRNFMNSEDLEDFLHKIKLINAS